MRTLTATLLIALALVATACGGRRDAGPRLSFAGEPYDTAALHLTLLTNVDCLPLIYAKRSGLADSMGLPLQLAIYRTQVDADTSLTGKLSDGGWADLTRLASHGRRGEGFEVMWRSAEAPVLFVSPTQRARKLKDLSGKTVALTRVSAETARFDRLLAAAGVRAADVYRPQIGDLSLRVMMLGGSQFDATYLCAPYTAWARAEGCRPLLTPKAADGREAFVMRRSVTATPQGKRRWSLFERVRRMAIDSLRTHGNAAYSLILQRDYGLPADVADTVRLHF